MTNDLYGDLITATSRELWDEWWALKSLLDEMDAESDQNTVSIEVVSGEFENSNLHIYLIENGTRGVTVRVFSDFGRYEDHVSDALLHALPRSKFSTEVNQILEAALVQFALDNVEVEGL